ncbi:MAG: DUF1214 domain-containing protein [Hyphomicrobiales bacterium]|nr:DUF1214 domain-containing protein [Hyphomicrobiales bacterium]
MSGARRAASAFALAIALGAGAVSGVFVARTLSQRAFEQSGRTVNGWMVNDRYGRFGDDHLLRTAAALNMLGANWAEESLYFYAARDGDGRALDGRSNYVLHFARNSLPPANAFWSLTIVGADDLMLTENEIGRYAIGDRTKGVVRNEDGSLDIYIQHNQPEAGASNWLPCPARPFHVILRLYEPGKDALKGSWEPPRIMRRDTLA